MVISRESFVTRSGIDSEQMLELLHRQTRLSQNGAKQALAKFVVIGDRDPPVWRRSLTHDDVASSLPVFLVPGLDQRGHHLASC